MRRTTAAIVGILLTGGLLVPPGRATADTADIADVADIAAWTFRTLSAPKRVQVLDAGSRPLATFTVGARTVTVRGPLLAGMVTPGLLKLTSVSPAASGSNCAVPLPLVGVVENPG